MQLWGSLALEYKAWERKRKEKGKEKGKEKHEGQANGRGKTSQGMAMQCLAVLCCGGPTVDLGASQMIRSTSVSWRPISVDGEGDLELRMRGSTAGEQGGGDAGGSNAENRLPGGAQVAVEGAVKKGLPGPPGALQEEVAVR